jgi:5-formyltetrahydrofolate cyclo-ligase
LIEKKRLRAEMRERRSEHVAAIPDSMRALLFLRPPAPLAAMIPEGATIGLYHAIGAEAPASSYAKWFHERGHRIALPWFAGRGAAMEFREWDNPLDPDGLVSDPYGAMQPAPTAAALTPQVQFVPLLAFTSSGDRLGQGGGYYDRWLAANPQTIAIGLGWDCQLVSEMPIEDHDHHLSAVVTPTRLYGPF